MKNNVTEKKHNELRPFTNTLTQRVSNITQTLDKLSTSGILDKKQTEKGTFYSASIPFLKFYIPF
ncbi:TPA: hypothetical protein DCZ39_05740 [Patescibacteria group bacterium]|nr:hypothetical protein [Candidatus Gracilibacteria bacterium]